MVKKWGYKGPVLMPRVGRSATNRVYFVGMALYIVADIDWPLQGE